MKKILIASLVATATMMLPTALMAEDDCDKISVTKSSEHIGDLKEPMKLAKDDFICRKPHLLAAIGGASMSKTDLFADLTI